MNNERVYYSHDSEMQAMRARAVLTLIFLTGGLVIGAVLTVLFTPLSGRKVRADLSKTIGQGWNTGHDAIEPIVKRLEEEFAELRKNVEERLK